MLPNSSRLLPSRNRTALACNACKKVKSKCDGERPACGRCAHQSSECVYTQNVNGKRTGRQEERRAHIALKRKVSELEARLVSSNSEQMVGSDGPEERPSPAQGSTGGLSNTGSRGTGSAIDTLATGAFDHKPSADIGYFGPTANHAMFRAVTAAMVNSGYRLTLLRQQEGEKHDAQRDFANLQVQPTPSIDQSLAVGRADGGVGIGAVVDEHYPSSLVARQWVTLFFDTVGAVLPYVSEASLLTQIDAAGSRLECKRPLEALLNIVFAHALAAVGKDSVAESFYHRTVLLLLMEEQAVSNPTLETVQALLLLGSFQQNSQRAMASLAPHALAVKASYQLGLHSPSCYEGLNTSDKELRSKLWFAVVNQDMILASALGRPCVVPPHYVRYQILNNVVPEQIALAGLSLPSSIENIVYFRHVSSLHQIMGFAVDSIYGSNIGSISELTPTELNAKTTELLFRLQKWHNSIKPFSILPGDVDMSLWLSAKFHSERYAILLSIYYHKTIMLVCMPLLIVIMESVTDSTNKKDAALNEMIFGLSAPILKRELQSIRDYQRLVNGILRYQPSFFKKNAVWWACNFISLTMSLNLFAFWLVCLLSKTMAKSLSTAASEVENFLLEALHILKSVGGTSMMSLKAHQCLQRYVCLARAIAPYELEPSPRMVRPANPEELIFDAQNNFLSSRMFLWDGFPDVGMTQVGDIFSQHMESDFMAATGLGTDQGSTAFDS